MTELEAATIAFQEATIAYQNASLYVLIRMGTEQRREEANQHHTETMRALEILIERTARS